MPDALRGKVVVHYQVRRTGLHMGTHQIVGAVVQQIMPEAAPLHRTTQSGNLCSIRAVGGDDIIGAKLRVLCAQITIKPVAVVAGIGAALAHQPDAPVRRAEGTAHCTQQLAQQHDQQLFQVAQRTQQLIFHPYFSPFSSSGLRHRAAALRGIAAA